MNPHAIETPDNDEIDLTELLAKLWRGRWLIAGVTAAGIGLAATYAFTAEQAWTSQATIEVPRVEALGDYYTAQMALRRITGQAVETPQEVAQDVFQELIRQLNAPDQRRESLRNSTYYKEKAARLTDEPEAQQLLLERINTEDFTVQPPDGKKTVYNRISFTATSPTAARHVLGSYLGSLNKQVWTTKVNELNLKIGTVKKDLSKEMDDIQADANARNRALLDTTRRAKDTASRGKIESFRGSSYQAIPEADMLFLLGTRSLQARIDTLQSTAPSLPARYYQAQRKLKELESLPKLTISNKSSFRYLEAPTLPLRKDKPKRSLIVALGAIGGLLLGCLWVLGRDALAGLRDKLKD